MPAYKVYYFPLRGAGEVIRQVLTVAKQPFDDVRIAREDWPKHKAEMPFLQMPVLEEDGKKLAQSFSAARYLARKYGLAGKNALEEANVDALADQWRDFSTEVRPYFMVLFGMNQGDLEKLKADVFLPGIKKHLPFFVAALKKSGSGYLVGSGLTWVDLLVADNLASFEEKNPKLLDDFPELRAHFKKVQSQPELKKWIERRPKTDF